MVVKKMTKHLRTVKASIIIGILLVSVLIAFSAPVSAAREPAVTFNSYIDIEYDVSPLNQPLEIDVAVTIPITIKYWTDLPPLEFIPGILWQLKFFILFRKTLGPMQAINLELSNTPEWANIYLTSPLILTNIPFNGEEPMEIDTNLVISPRVEAPAESYSIGITATSDPIFRLNGFSIFEEIPFTPSFVPTIQISPQNPIRTVGPHESISFSIDVENLGNKITRVTPDLIGIDDKWTPTINPPNYEIPPKSKSTFTFSVISPFDFGWHNEYGSFEIEFLSEVYPYQSSAATNTESIYLVVNNYGFSTPGFEFAVLLIGLIVTIFIMQKRRKVNR